MAYTESTQPYEFFARWADDGTLQGVHVGYRWSLKDDTGKEVANKALDVQPVALTDADKLSAIGAQINTQALIDKQTADAARTQAESERDAAKADAASKQTALDSIKSERDGLKASLADAQAQLAISTAQVQQLQAMVKNLTAITEPAAAPAPAPAPAAPMA